MKWQLLLELKYFLHVWLIDMICLYHLSGMATKPQGEVTQTVDSQQEGSPEFAGWGGKIISEYRRIKENAETYPYVWASYILVYGGFGLWFTYRWRKLRRTEDSVRNLQAKLRKLVEEENAANSAAVPQKPTNSAVIPEKPMNSMGAIPKKPTNTTSLTDTPPANKATK